MKYTLLICVFVFFSSTVFSQTDFNKWSIEASLGPNKPMGPLTPGYLSPTLNLGHLDLGVRYMINDYFGLKGDLGVGSFSEAKGVSPVFTSNYFRMNFQGVGNIGKMLDLQSLSRNLGLLFHFGTGLWRLSFEDSRLNAKPDYHYNFIGLELLYFKARSSCHLSCISRRLINACIFAISFVRDPRSIHSRRN